jgi:uncharacterized protein HemY
MYFLFFIKNGTMSIAEKKMEMVALITRLNNAKAVNAMYAKMQEAQTDTQDGWNDLSSEEQRELEIAIAETYDPTKLVSHETALKMIDQWLGK